MNNKDETLTLGGNARKVLELFSQPRKNTNLKANNFAEDLIQSYV